MARKDSKGRNLHTGESERKTDGIYMYRYMDIKGGKRQTIYASDLPELRLKEKQIQKDLDDSILTDSTIRKMTLNDLFERYMDTRELSDSTRVNYLNMWNNRAKEEIGNLRVVQLKSSQVKAFYLKLSKAGYSHSTIKLIHTLLYPALELAVEDDIIRKNPAKNCLSSDYGAKAIEKDVLTVAQQKELLDFISKSNVYNVYLNMVIILLEVGIRCGELIGLTWADVDMAQKDLYINHQLIYRDYGEGYMFHASTPKTEAGIRQIPLSQKAHRAFAEQKKINFMLGRRCTENIDGYSDFVFLARTGRPLMPSAVNNIIYNIVDAYNKEEVVKSKKEHRKAELLPKISAHNLRHTACTNLARKGMQIKILAYLMGHSSTTITNDTYNHIADMLDVKKEVDKCEKAVGI